ncbi:MAG: hypothetical protein GOMPHAMPRED_001889 [Gomphillus americanus]|uniref:Mitochondrial import inner membrane translocase subunit TIM44 n=1 Tax=Gomphillus americanus TaxID=1940652 RepID=A0A8H3F741_9LECA|nr:MAG: hypothetical protein GOMPHAMPRED_001889 [Gomphillus americanus]
MPRIQNAGSHQSSSEIFIRSLFATTDTSFLLHPSTIRSPLLSSSLRTFSTHSFLLAENQKPEKSTEPEQEAQTSKDKQEDSTSGDAKSKDAKSEQKAKSDDPPPPPHGDKTPWQVFTETLSKEFKASKEWNESTKQLSDSANDFSESESVRRARAAYSAASEAASSKTSAALKSTGKVIGQGASWTWETPVMKGVRKGASAAGRGLDAATKPLRETEAFKSVKDVIDDGSSSRYGGWTEKEERRKARELREQEEIKSGKRMQHMEEDPNAGTNVTVHKDAAWKQSWQEFKESNRMMQGLFAMKSTYQESDNALISTARSISDRVAGFFAENETARVIKKFREMDPNFQLEPFLREMREYILPEVLDAYVKGETETLKLWLSAAQFNVYHALQQEWTKNGLKVDGKILDIRHVDMLSARMLEPGDIPVFVITCRTQEVHVYRQIKTGQLAAGMEDKVQLVTYAIGVTRLPEEVSNPETRGWRLIELQKSGRDYI